MRPLGNDPSQTSSLKHGAGTEKSAIGALSSVGLNSGKKASAAATSASARTSTGLSDAKAGASVKATGFSSLATFLAQRGLPLDALGKAVVASLMGENASLTSHAVNIIRTAVLARLPASGRSGSVPLMARDVTLASRVFARAHALGIALADPLLERVLRMCGFGSDSSPGTDPSQGGDPGTDPSPGGDPGTDPGQGGTDPSPGGDPGTDPDQGGSDPSPGGDPGSDPVAIRIESTKTKLTQALIAQFPRWVADALANSDLARLAQPARDGQRWIIAPFNLSIDNIDFWGSFRILLQGQTLNRLVADIRSTAGCRLLCLSGSPPSILLREVDADEDELYELEAFDARSV